jgi:putative spermidine/putrescine transport system permease protein
MVAAIATDIVRTADGIPLKQKLQRVERARKTRAVALVLPLFMFILVSFVWPIVVMLFNAVSNPEITTNMPQTIVALEGWNGVDLPDEAVFAALAADLKAATQQKTIALIGKRLNYEISGVRSKVIATGKKVAELTTGPYKDAIIGMDKVWGEIDTWATIRRAGSRYTAFYLLKSLDLDQDETGAIRWAPANRAIYIGVFVRTLGIGLTVTLATLLLGFPLAYLLAQLPPRTSNLLMILVLVPFWTSLLVRTTAWVVLLQSEGPINDLLIAMGFVDNPLQLILSRFGTIVAMTHIQLPFTLLPIYSVMKTIPPSHVRAARSLGAGPFYAFWRVYFPQTVPGIAAGCLLTFILSLGYYITPALVGGPKDQMISSFVADFINRESNWGMASALGAVLLVATLVLYFVYNRLIGIDKMKFG